MIWVLPFVILNPVWFWLGYKFGRSVEMGKHIEAAMKIQENSR